jgi:hypothetical protein
MIMTCPDCKAELITTKAGSMCGECGYAKGLKPLTDKPHQPAPPAITEPISDVMSSSLDALSVHDAISNHAKSSPAKKIAVKPKKAKA